MKTLYLGSDHGGFELKAEVSRYLSASNITAKDMGTFDTKSCDYPEIAQRVAQEVQKDKDNFGILICRSGVGMCIAANKFKGVYAACLSTFDSVVKARQHNAINVLCLSGALDLVLAKTLVEAFLTTDFDKDPRHCKRREQIYAIESKNFVTQTI